MARCNYWDPETGEQCPVEGDDVVRGYCSEHAYVKGVTSPPVTGDQGTSKPLWTSATARRAYPKVTAGRDKTGGEYLVNGAVGMHIHIYNDGGAHVKVGNTQFVFLRKPGFNFDQVNWDLGVAAVKERASEDIRRSLLNNMIWTVAEYGALTDQELTRLIENVER